PIQNARSHPGSTQPTVPHIRTRANSCRGSRRCAKQVAVDKVIDGAITNQKSRLTAKTACGDVRLPTSHRSPAATKERTVRQRSAGSQGAEICRAIGGASSEPIACVAQHQPISLGEKPSSLSRSEKIGTTAPGAV